MKQEHIFISMEEANAHYGIADNYMMTNLVFPEVKPIPKAKPTAKPEPVKKYEATKEKTEPVSISTLPIDIVPVAQEKTIEKPVVVKTASQIAYEEHLQVIEHLLASHLEGSYRGKSISVEKFFSDSFSDDVTKIRDISLFQKLVPSIYKGREEDSLQYFQSNHISFQSSTLKTISELNAKLTKKFIQIAHVSFLNILQKSIHTDFRQSTTEQSTIFTLFTILRESYFNKISKHNALPNGVPYHKINKDFTENLYAVAVEQLFQIICLINYLKDRTSKIEYAIPRIIHFYIYTTKNNLEKISYLDKIGLPEISNQLLYPHKNEPEQPKFNKEQEEALNNALIEKAYVESRISELEKANANMLKELHFNKNKVNEFHNNLSMLSKNISDKLEQQFEARVETSVNEKTALIKERLHATISNNFQKIFEQKKIAFKQEVKEELIQEAKRKAEMYNHEKYCFIDKFYDNPHEQQKTFVPHLISSKITIK